MDRRKALGFLAGGLAAATGARGQPVSAGTAVRRIPVSGEAIPVVGLGPLPGWAREIDCRTWAEAFLKWIAAHPAVTCSIPATSQLARVRENMRALVGPLPDAAPRRRIAEDYARA